MRDVTASRTLVKSAPELWTECSDAGSLRRHLGRFGEIRITRLEPETAVAWEGERACGTVRLEPSGWGTRVVMTATPAPAPEPAASAVAPERAELEVAVPVPEPEVVSHESAPRPGFLARLFARLRGRPDPPAQPEPEEPEPIPVQPEPEPVRLVPDGIPDPPQDPTGELDPQEALHAALDSLGQAHHRPFSRA